jgi:hypothetical protein
MNVPNEFLTAFDHVWQLPTGMGHEAIMYSQEFLHLRNMIDTYCYAQIKGNFFDPYLLLGLQKLGVPCFFTAGSQLAATDRATTAVLCYEALMQRHTRQIYLCPLDCAGVIPQITFGTASIKRFSKQELDALLNSLQLQRQPGYTPADIAGLSQFLWLVVEHEEVLLADFSERYWNWNTNDKPGTVNPYKHHHPEAVERAIFLLMLAPWEDWLINEEYHWRPFHIPWVHTLSGDIFSRQQPIPSASSLTWIPRSYHDENEGWYEYDAPYEYDYSLTSDQLMPYVDIQVQKNLDMAVTNGLINVAARHQFVKAFLSYGVDEFLAHIVVIDACVGEKSENKGMNKKLKALRDTGRFKYRLAGLLNDSSARDTIDALYKVRSNYVHGNELDKIPGEHFLQARTLARKTLNAIITSPQLTREVFLDDVLQRGWNLIEGGV